MIACVLAIEQESGLAREKETTPMLGKRAWAPAPRWAEDL